jgi:tetratricopeptide (TPR) repeat protein
VFAVLVLGIVGTAMGLVDARRQASKAESTREFLEWALVASSPDAQGRDVQMIEVLDEAVKRLQAESFTDDPDVKAALLLVIGQAYQQRGEFGKAEPALVQALQIYEHLDGEDARTVDAMAALCFLYHEQGRLAEGEAMSKRTLAIVRRCGLEQSAPEAVVGVLSTYSNVLRSQQRVDDAAPLVEEAYLLARRHLRPEQPAALTAANNAARLYDMLGRRDEAERIMREVVEVRRRTLGDDHPKTLISIDGLAFILHKMQRCDEAQPLFEEALAGFRKRKGEVDIDTLRCMGLFGTCLTEAGKFDRAEPLLAASIEGLSSTQGDPNIETVSARSRLVDLMLKMGRFADAEAECRRALTDSAGHLPAGMPLRLRLSTRLAQCLWLQKRFDDAEQQMQEALAEAQQVPNNGKGIAGVERWFAELFDAWGKPAAAAAHRKTAAELDR